MRWMLIALLALCLAGYDDPPPPPPGTFDALAFPEDTEEDRPLANRPTYQEPPTYPKVLLLERSNTWQTISKSAVIDSLVKYGDGVHIHRFRLLTTQGRLNALELRADADAAGKPWFQIQGYNYWHHVTYPPGSIVWATAENRASLDSLGSQYTAFKIDGLPSIAWKGSPDTTNVWHHGDLYDEDRLEWGYGAWDYVHKYVDVIKKYNRLWGDVPLNGYMFDYFQSTLFNNFNSPACPGSAVCALDLDLDGIIDYDGYYAPTGWRNTQARDGWVSTSQYAIKHLAKTWPEAWLVANGISHEACTIPSEAATVFGPLALETVPHGVATNYEAVHYNDSQSFAQNAGRQFEDRIRWAIAAEQDYGWTRNVLAMFYSEFSVAAADLIRTGLVLSCLTGQWTMIEVQATDLVTFETNIQRLAAQDFEAGVPLGPAVATDLGGGVTRYTRPFTNGVARVLIKDGQGWNGTTVGTADSIRFDPWP